MLKFSIASYERGTAVLRTDVTTMSTKTCLKRHEGVFVDVNGMSRFRSK